MIAAFRKLHLAFVPHAEPYSITNCRGAGEVQRLAALTHRRFDQPRLFCRWCCDPAGQLVCIWEVVSAGKPVPQNCNKSQRRPVVEISRAPARRHDTRRQ